MRRREDCAGLAYPSCPKCNSDQIMRYGITRATRQQRFRCKLCRAQWTPGYQIQSRVRGPQGTFLPCDKVSVPVAEKDSGIEAGLYLERMPLPGGPVDLEKNLPILERRVRACQLTANIKEELLQIACLDVLERRGSCESVKLRISKAKKAVLVYGMGSDHPAYRLHNGQAWLQA